MTLVELKKLLNNFKEIFQQLIDPEQPKSQLNVFAAYAVKKIDAAITLLDHQTLPANTILEAIRVQLKLIIAEGKKHELNVDDIELSIDEPVNLSHLHERLKPKTIYTLDLTTDLKNQRIIAIQQQQQAGIKLSLQTKSHAYPRFLIERLETIKEDEANEKIPTQKPSSTSNK